MPTLYLDIETIPSRNPAVIARVTKKAKADAVVVDGDTEALDKIVAAKLDATALDAVAGEVCVIAAAIDDGDVRTWARDMTDVDGERKLLLRFTTALAGRSFKLVGHNVLDFDRRFLRQRGIVLGVPMPRTFTAEVKPWEQDAVGDTMRMWCGDHRGRVSLDALACAFGIEGKGAIDGSMVAGMVADGRIDEVATYCADDVRMVREVYRHLIANS